jgi:GDP-4-dehydro-6-deoxy-D-mannose reductase
MQLKVVKEPRMNVLITGAGGFIGSYLAQFATRAGHRVLGIGLRESDFGVFEGDFRCIDVCDAERIAETVHSFKPDRIFHLAAQSYPTVSMERPYETMQTNACGTINIFEAVRDAKIKPVVVVACSSAEYGRVEAEDLPVRESHPLRPLHPYGVSKVAQDLLTAQYFENYGIPSVRIRIFNTTGPGKREDICGDFTKRAVEIELGISRAPMMVGSLTTRRAIIDVRDMVRALWLSCEGCTYGDVYNVGSSHICSGEEIVEMIRSHIKVPLILQQDSSLLRTSDERVIAGDTSKFRSCTGWSPEIDLNDTIRDMIQWWRNRLASQPAVTMPVEAPNVVIA